MPVDIILPQWGMGMNDALVVRWIKEEGDRVEKGEPLVEVESAKVKSELEAPAEGTLSRILAVEGSVAPVGASLGIILLPSEDPESQEIMEHIEKLRQPVPQDPVKPSESEVVAQSRVVATPRARRLAIREGVALDAVKGSGPGGRILEDDVRLFASISNASTAESYEGAASTVSDVVPLTGMRKTISARMTQSAQIPQVTLVSSINLGGINVLQKRLVSAWRKYKIRPNYQDFVVMATALALRETPHANAHMVRDEIHLMADVNIGVAVAVPEGLLVPVVRNADAKPLLEIAKEIRLLMHAARKGDLKISQVSGGTFSITNLSGSCVDFFNPLINPPEVGILGLGRKKTEVERVGEDGCASVEKSTITLTFDHRAWDGAPAAAFLGKIVDYLSEPSWMVKGGEG